MTQFVEMTDSNTSAGVIPSRAGIKLTLGKNIVFEPCSTSGMGIYKYLMPKLADRTSSFSLQITKAHFPNAPHGMRYVLGSALSCSKTADTISHITLHVGQQNRGHSTIGLCAGVSDIELKAASDKTLTSAYVAGDWDNHLLLLCFVVLRNGQIVPTGPGSKWFLEVAITSNTARVEPLKETGVVQLSVVTTTPIAVAAKAASSSHRQLLAETQTKLHAAETQLAEKLAEIQLVETRLAEKLAEIQLVEARLADHNLANLFLEDMNRSGYVWCVSCQQSLQKNSIYSHKKTIKHRDSLCRIR